MDIGAYEVQGSSSKICPGSTLSIKANLTGASYQWQVDIGNGYNNITNTAVYSGVTTGTLQITTAPSSWYGYKYRCAVGAAFSNEVTLQFLNSWTGAINTAWENTGDWSCGILPDANTNVVIGSGTVAVNSMVAVKSLSVDQGVQFNVTPPNQVTLTGGAAASGTLGGSPGSCTSTTLSGIYKQRVSLTAANTVQVQVNVLVTGPYFISTNTVNSISFSKAGTFTSTGVQNIILNGTGTPEFSGGQTFPVQFSSSACSFNINFAAATPDYLPIVTNSY